MYDTGSRRPRVTVIRAGAPKPGRQETPIQQGRNKHRQEADPAARRRIGHRRRASMAVITGAALLLVTQVPLPAKAGRAILGTRGPDTLRGTQRRQPHLRGPLRLTASTPAPARTSSAAEPGATVIDGGRRRRRPRGRRGPRPHLGRPRRRPRRGRHRGRSASSGGEGNDGARRRHRRRRARRRMRATTRSTAASAATPLQGDGGDDVARLPGPPGTVCTGGTATIASTGAAPRTSCTAGTGNDFLVGGTARDEVHAGAG